jgi:hypothetical protein
MVGREWDLGVCHSSVVMGDHLETARIVGIASLYVFDSPKTLVLAKMACFGHLGAVCAEGANQDGGLGEGWWWFKQV